MNGKKKLVLLFLGFFCFITCGNASLVPGFRRLCIADTVRTNCSGIAAVGDGSSNLTVIKAHYNNVTLVLYFNSKGDVIYSWEKLSPLARAVELYDVPMSTREKMRKEMKSHVPQEMDSKNFLPILEMRGEWCARCLYNLKMAVSKIDFNKVRAVLVGPRSGRFLRSQKGLLESVYNEFSDLRYLHPQDRKKMQNILDYLKKIACGKIPA